MAEPRPVPDQTRKQRYEWDRQDKEPQRAYGYFVAYRDAGRARKVGDIADGSGISRDYGWRLSKTWKWARRAEAWDRELDRTFAEAVADRRRDAARSTMEILRFARIRATERLRDMDWSKLTPDQLLRWLEATIKLEREVLGQPQKVEVSGSNGGPVQLHVEAMTDDERRAYAERLMAEARTRFQLDQPAMPAMLRAVHHDSLTSGGGDGSGGSDMEHVVRGPNGSAPAAGEGRQ